MHACGGAAPALSPGMLRGLVVVLVTARASADPLTFAVRGGTEAADLDWRYQSAHTTAPALEIEGGVWVSDHVTLTAVAGSVTHFEIYDGDLGSTSTVHDGRIGARVTWHAAEPTPPVFAGVGTGATLQTSRDDPGERDAMHYTELFAGGTLAHAGPIGFQAMGEVAFGGMATRQLTLGVAWDPPHGKIDSRMRPDGVIAGVHVGKAYTTVDDGYLMPQGWGPWLEAELGARVSPHAALLGFATYTHISGDSVLQDIGTKTYTEHYELTHTRVGVRVRGWLAPRAYVSAGAGLMYQQLEDANGGNPFFELEAGVEPLQVGPIALEVTSFYEIMFDARSSGFAIGVAYR